MKKKRLTKKEKREIGLILGSVFLVAIVAVITINLTDNNIESVTGKAATIDKSKPSQLGMLVYLKDYCGSVVDTGTCDEICAKTDRKCLPVEENCDFSMESNSCWCCAEP